MKINIYSIKNYIEVFNKTKIIRSKINKINIIIFNEYKGLKINKIN